MSIPYANQSESLSWSFFDLSGGKWCLQLNTRADNMKHQTVKNCPKCPNSCHRMTEVVKDMCDK